MTQQIPQNFLDLVQNPYVALFSTVTPDGKPQSSPVWFKYDGTNILINSAVGRQKDKNVVANPHVAVTVVDPANMYRYIEIRGVVMERTEEGGVDLINELAQAYVGKSPYYGGVAPAERAEVETRVTYVIQPEQVIAHG